MQVGCQMQQDGNTSLTRLSKDISANYAGLCLAKMVNKFNFFTSNSS